MLTWAPRKRGYQETVDRAYSVESDALAYITLAERDGTGVGAGVTGGEWAAVRDPYGDDETLDWFPTKREAKAYCERHAKETR